MNIKEIKSKGKTAFKANYWRCVLVAFLLGILTKGTATATGSNATDAKNNEAKEELSNVLDSLSTEKLMKVAGIILGAAAIILLISFLLRFFLFNPLQVGGYRFFRKNASDADTRIGTLSEGFGQYGHTFVVLLLRDIFIFCGHCFSSYRVL